VAPFSQLTCTYPHYPTKHSRFEGMTLDLTTPALLFPAISLLLLAYTNRFLALAALIRGLQARYESNPDSVIVAQISNLRYRVRLIQQMQAFGVLSLFGCVACMFALFADLLSLGNYLFGISLVLMLVSLGLSVREIQVSVVALNLHLQNLEGRIPD
jgi:hypothetical protein